MVDIGRSIREQATSVSEARRDPIRNKR